MPARQKLQRLGAALLGATALLSATQAEAAVQQVTSDVGWAGSLAACGGGAVMGAAAGSVIPALGTGLGAAAGCVAMLVPATLAGSFFQSIMGSVWNNIGIPGAQGAVEDQGNRIGAPPGYVTAFSGTATGEDGVVTYSGTRTGAFVEGGYSGQDGSGTFAGVINRGGTVSGVYVEGEERGSFSGQATPDLGSAFGGGACTSGCDEDD